MKLADLYVEFRAKGLGRINASLKQMQARLKSAETMMVSVGAVARKAFALSAGAVGGSTWAVVKFQDQMAMVSTMLDETSMKIMPRFSRGIRSLSKDFGESTTTLSKGLYDILSASIAPAKALNVLTVAVKSARAGFTTTAVSADAITTILNSYGMAAERAGEVSDKLFATVKRGKLTYSELASSIGKAATTAAVAGVSLDELLALVATMTRAGINADMAMTSVVGAIRSFLAPTDDAIKLAKQLGFEMNTATLGSIGFSGVLKLITKLSAEQLRVLFPNIRGLRGIAAAMQDLTGLGKDLNLMLNSIGMTQEAFAKATSTLSFKLSQLKQTLIDIARVMGFEFVPYISRAIELIKVGTKWFRSLSDETRKTIAKITLLTVGVSGLLLVLPKVISLLRGVVAVLAMITKHPILALASAAAAAYVKVRGLSGATEDLGKAWKWVLDVVRKVVAGVRVAIENWRTILEMMWVTLQLQLVTFWEEFKHTFTVRIPYTLKWFAANWGRIFKNIWNFTRTIFENIYENNKRTLSAFMKWMLSIDWKGLWTKLYNSVVWLNRKIKDVFERTFTAIWNWIKNLDWKKLLKTIFLGPAALSKLVLNRLQVDLEEVIANATDPKWEFKWKPLTEGFKPIKLDPFDIPERVMTDAERRLWKRLGQLRQKLKKAWEEMLAVDIKDPLKIKEVAEKVADVAGAIVGKVKAGKEGLDLNVKVKADTQAGVFKGIVDVWRDIQSGILKDDVPRQQLVVQQGMHKELKEISKKIPLIMAVTP